MDRDRIVPRSESFLDQYNMNYQHPMEAWEQDAFGMPMKGNSHLEKQIYPPTSLYEPIFNFSSDQAMHDMNKDLALQYSLPDMSPGMNVRETDYAMQHMTGKGKKPTSRARNASSHAKTQEKKIATKKAVTKKGASNSKAKEKQKEKEIKDEQRMRRLLRNRVSAQLARERKKHYMQGLEKKARDNEKKIKELVETNAKLLKENQKLKEMLRGENPGESS